MKSLQEQRSYLITKNHSPTNCCLRFSYKIRKFCRGTFRSTVCVFSFTFLRFRLVVSFFWHFCDFFFLEHVQRNFCKFRDGHPWIFSLQIGSIFAEPHSEGFFGRFFSFFHRNFFRNSIVLDDCWRD